MVLELMPRVVARLKPGSYALRPLSGGIRACEFSLLARLEVA